MRNMFGVDEQGVVIKTIEDACSKCEQIANEMRANNEALNDLGMLSLLKEKITEEFQSVAFSKIKHFG